MTQSTAPTTNIIIAPREGSKQAKLVTMLSRKTGVTLAKASEALGWQVHTTSATMTGLRKRGYVIGRQVREGKDSVYNIRPFLRTHSDGISRSTRGFGPCRPH